MCAKASQIRFQQLFYASFLLICPIRIYNPKPSASPKSVASKSDHSKIKVYIPFEDC